MSRGDFETEPAAARKPGGWLHDWRLRLGAAIVAVVAVVLAGHAIDTGNMYARLMQSDPDGGAETPSLARFAAAQAKPVYARECASCHGADMKGDPARGVPSLADNDWLYGGGRVPEIEKTILYGIRSGHPKAWNLAEMPGFGKAIPAATYKTVPLTPGEIRDLVNYLRLLGDKSSDPAAAARGVKLFNDKGQCFDCHAEDGRGDAAIGAPNLTDDIWLYGDGSFQSVFNSIAHGHHGACPAWTRHITAGQARALAVYIHNQSHPPAAGPAQSHAAAAAAPHQQESLS